MQLAIRIMQEKNGTIKGKEHGKRRMGLKTAICVETSDAATQGIL